MSTVIVRRPKRRQPPGFPHGEFALQEPPALPEAQGGQLSTLLMTLPMVASSAVMLLMFVQPGVNKTLMYMAGGMMAVSMIAMGIGTLTRASGERKSRLKGERRDYLRYLGQVRKKVRQAITAQQESMLWIHPNPGRLWVVAGSDRLWERRASHHDFGEVRVGLGAQRLALRLQAPQTKPVEDLEPLCAGALRRFLHAYSTVDNLPMAVYLRTFARILLRGDSGASRAMVRSMVAQLVTFHSPDDLRIAVCASRDRLSDWDWLKWLPHALHPSEQDAAGPVRLVVDSWPELESLLGSEEFSERPRFETGTTPSAAEPYVVVILDGCQVPNSARPATGGYRNAVIVDVAGCLPWKVTDTALCLEIEADAIKTVELDRAGAEKTKKLGQPDQLSVARCRTLARQIAPFRAGITVESSDATATDIELTTLLNIDDARAITADEVWKPRSPWDFLRVPIGVTETGSPVELDIKESAQGGMGPHGILIGATGSGKSELLRTLVLSMAMTHSSEVLNLVLVDFKGGATFAGLDRLPHVSAFITNLADEITLVDRMQDALHGELVRRQEALRAAGFSSVTDYEKARSNGTALEPFPTLFVIVDEFGELLANKSEFMELFVMIGRLGRSLGVHLLLASQRLEEGRIQSLETHLSYRIGLRMFSVMESRSVLGVGDAYEQPLQAGSGFLRTDTTTLVKFKGAYVSGAYRPERAVVRRRIVDGHVVPYGVGYLAPVVPRELEPVEPEPVVDEVEVDSMLEVVVDRLRGQGMPARTVWLPPLGAAPTLDELLPMLATDVKRGYGVPLHAGGGALKVPVAIVDRPFEQRRDHLVADLSGGNGHVGIVGAPQMGKTNVARTLIAGLALTHTPAEAQFYILDFGGGGLSSLAGLPHVGSVAGRLEKDRANRTVAELMAVLAERERRFGELRVDSMAAYRKLRRSGEVDDDPYGDVFLVIDGWFTLHQEFEHLETMIQEIAARGLSYGIHVVVTSNRWSEIRPWLRDLLGTRFELRLGDSIESEMDFRVAKSVPEIPGRGLAKDKSHFLTALARIDGDSAADTASDGVRGLVSTVAAAWSGAPAPVVRLLPPQLAVSELPEPPLDGLDLRMALGVEDVGLKPVWHDFGQDPHLMIFGEAEMGKSNLLRLVARGIAQRFTPSEARVLLADPRRQLHESIPAEYHLGLATSAPALRDAATEIAAAMQQRVPGTDIAPDRLPLRDWWKGPQLFVLVDDYDLLTSPMSSSLEPLVEVAAQGVDIGLHIVVARSSANATRGMADAMLRRLWDIGAPALQLSTRKDDGSFLGDVRPKTLPPGRAQFINRRRIVQLVQTGNVSNSDTGVSAA